ncbi:hypothetical protein DFJ73DRAFT_854588 [Zopfochytrium polystomum]|nr:hypothetical protein DFJ73DRAFT_854588 [Zopfochytrium polystomum]
MMALRRSHHHTLNAAAAAGAVGSSFAITVFAVIAVLVVALLTSCSVAMAQLTQVQGNFTVTVTNQPASNQFCVGDSISYALDLAQIPTANPANQSDATYLYAFLFGPPQNASVDPTGISKTPPDPAVWVRRRCYFRRARVGQGFRRAERQGHPFVSERPGVARAAAVVGGLESAVFNRGGVRNWIGVRLGVDRLRHNYEGGFERHSIINDGVDDDRFGQPEERRFGGDGVVVGIGVGCSRQPLSPSAYNPDVRYNVSSYLALAAFGCRDNTSTVFVPSFVCAMITHQTSVPFFGRRSPAALRVVASSP